LLPARPLLVAQRLLQAVAQGRHRGIRPAPQQQHEQYHRHQQGDEDGGQQQGRVHAISVAARVPPVETGPAHSVRHHRPATRAILGSAPWRTRQVIRNLRSVVTGTWTAAPAWSPTRRSAPASRCASPTATSTSTTATAPARPTSRG